MCLFILSATSFQLPVTNLPRLQYFVEIAFYVSVALILFGLIYRIIRKDESVKMAILAVGAYILTIGAGIVASFVIRPVLVERYMVPVLGLFVLGLSYGIGSLGKKILPIIGCAVIIAFSVPQQITRCRTVSTAR